MGLDMYLRASICVGGWNHGKDAKFDRLVDLMGVAPDSGSPSITVSVTVGYWRKANAIHAWFVKNVQDGTDDCREHYVSREKLEELRAACVQVLGSVETIKGRVSEGTTYHAGGGVTHHTREGDVVAQPGVAASVLPTQSGFFFGKTEYDEDYLTDLRETVTIIDRVLTDKALEGADIYYDSSW